MTANNTRIIVDNAGEITLQLGIKWAIDNGAMVPELNRAWCYTYRQASDALRDLDAYLVDGTYAHWDAYDPSEHAAIDPTSEDIVAGRYRLIDREALSAMVRDA